MGITKRRQTKYKKQEKRKKRRQKLAKSGKNPDEYFYGGIYVAKPVR